MHGRYDDHAVPNDDQKRGRGESRQDVSGDLRDERRSFDASLLRSGGERFSNGVQGTSGYAVVSGGLSAAEIAYWANGRRSRRISALVMTSPWIVGRAG